MSSIEVSGGVAGLAVTLEELQDAAARLRTLADDLLEVTLAIGRLSADPALAAAGALAPAELLEVERALASVAGPGGAAGSSARLLATGTVTDLAVRAYLRGEDAAERLADDAATTVGVWAGTAVGTAIGGIGLPAVGVGVLAVPLAGTALATPVGAEIGDDVQAGVAGLGRSVGGEIDEMLFDQPWLVPAAADGLDGFVTGLGNGLPPLGAWLGWRSARAGAVYPPRTRDEALRVIVAAASGTALDESDKRVRVRAHGAPRHVPAPRSLAGLVARDGPTSGRDRLRVTGIPGPEGRWRWIVDVPGTQSFDPRAGENPWDLTSDVLLSARGTSLTSRGVARALDDARARTGARRSGPVMLTGHSQGGLTAAALAANPRFREDHDVTHVVTSGAPIGHVPVPEGVSVLSLEHEEDLVAGLDGAPNPDREDWVTVRRSLAEDLPADAGATDAHALGEYTETAGLVDESDHPSVRAWREGAAPFLGDPDRLLAPDAPEVVVIDYDIERVPE